MVFIVRIMVTMLLTLTDLAGLHERVSVVFIASIMIVMLLTLTLLVCMNELVWFSLPAL